MKPVHFLTGLIAGVVAGSLGTLFLTPRSGRDMRESLTREAKRLAVRTTGLHPREWSEIAAEESGRSVLENIGRIRAAGL
ncbi:MAG TPA: YtxH domain-containing protein [Vicinamibacteria bacterium]|nr:YtxH domain-containing protein [Vicinamibacteria bacterium]